MTRKRARDDGIRLTDDSAENCHASKSVGGFSIRSLRAGLLVTVAAALFPVAGYSQTLDDAVNAQLEAFILPAPIGQKPCGRLLGSDPASDLTGQLGVICGRGAPGGGAPPAQTTGGGGATPTKLPAIVQKRLRGKPPKKDKSKQTAGASADSVVELDSGIGLFFSSEFESLDRDITTFQDGFQSDIWRVTAGVDYKFTRRILAGLAFDYYNHKGEFDGGGSFDNNSYGFLAFGSFLPTDKVFVQAYAGYNLDKKDRNRVATFTDEAGVVTQGLPEADYDADQTSAGIRVGYDQLIGDVTIGPWVGFDFYHIDFGTYSEKRGNGLGLTFHEDEMTSLQTRLGLQTSTVLSTGWGLIVPLVSFDWIHEFENDQRNIVVSFVDDIRANPKQFSFQNERPDRDAFQLNAGAIMELKNKIHVFANYRPLIGHSFFDSHAAMIGLRFPL